MIDNRIVSDKLGYIAEFFVFQEVFMNRTHIKVIVSVVLMI